MEGRRRDYLHAALRLLMHVSGMEDELTQRRLAKLSPRYLERAFGVAAPEPFRTT